MADDHAFAHLDEEGLAGLLRFVPAPPAAWVQAAAELPLARLALADVERRVLEGAEQRAAVTADLQAALDRAGHPGSPAFVAAVRRLAARADG